MKVIYDAVTGFPRRADDWNEIENRPEEFPPAAHTHVEADVTDLHRHDNKADLDLVGEHVSDKGTAVFRNMVDGGKMAFTNASGVTSCVSLTDGSDKRHIQMYSHDPKGTCTRVAINPSGAYYADSDGDDFDDGNKIARIKDLKNVKIELDDEQKAALKGDAGPAGPAGAAAGFGTPTATATTLEAGQAATVKVTASGNDTGKVFSFEFGIPKGEKGESGAAGSGGGSSSGAPALPVILRPPLNSYMTFDDVGRSGGFIHLKIEILDDIALQNKTVCDSTDSQYTQYLKVYDMNDSPGTIITPADYPTNGIAPDPAPESAQHMAVIVDMPALIEKFNKEQTDVKIELNPTCLFYVTWDFKVAGAWKRSFYENLFYPAYTLQSNFQWMIHTAANEDYVMFAHGNNPCEGYPISLKELKKKLEAITL